MSDKKIWYENHPVTAERKAELRAKGYTIVDAVFMPEGHVQEVDGEGAKPLTVPQLKEALTAKGIEIPEGAKKADLQALLDASE